MTKTILASTITALTLTAASTAFADPIRIVQNGSGVAGLSYSFENGVEDSASDPDAVGGPNSFRLSTRVGGTSADAAAELVSDFRNPSRLSGTGSTSASYATEVGRGEGNVASYYFVFFELDQPQQFLFDGDLQTSGDAFSTPTQERRSDWEVSLFAMDSTGNIVRPILIERGTDSTRLVREGVLTAGIYRFLVQGTSFAASFLPGRASGNVHSNFAFSLDLNDGPAPVPEPGSVLLLGTGLAAILGAKRRERWRRAVEFRERAGRG